MIGSIIVVGFFLLGCLLGWAGVLLFMELINRSLHKIVDCVDEMYPD